MKTIFTIWTQPKKTFEYLEEHKESIPDIRLDTMFYLGALAMVLPSIPGMPDKYKLLYDLPVAIQIVISVLLSLIIAFLVALLLKYVNSFVLWAIGKAFQGQASSSQVRLVMAYSLIPGMVSIFFSCLLIIIALITKDTSIIGYQNPFTLFLIWIFGFRTLIYGIAQFNRFSYGYALLTIIVTMSFIQGVGMLLKLLLH